MDKGSLYPTTGPHFLDADCGTFEESEQVGSGKFVSSHFYFDYIVKMHLSVSAI
jgi:hypothetical protein